MAASTYDAMPERAALAGALTAIADRDTAAFSAVIADQAPAIHALALRILQSEDLAHSAVVRTFAALWRMDQQTRDEAAPADLVLWSLARSKIREIHERSGSGRLGLPANLGFEIRDPVRDGSASLELLQILTTLGRVDDATSAIVMVCFFDAPRPDVLNETLGLKTSEIDAHLRDFCKAFLATERPEQPQTVLHGDVDALGRALWLKPSRVGSSDSLSDAFWRMRLAALGALLVPVAVRPALEDDIWSAIDSDTAEIVSKAVAADRRTDELRAAGRYLLGAVAAGAAVFLIVSQLVGNATSARSNGPDQASAVHKSKGDSE